VSHPAHSVVSPAGPQASQIDGLWQIFLAVSVVVCVGVIAVELVAVTRAVRNRRRDGEPDPTVVDKPQERRLVTIIATFAALTVLTLLVLLVASVRTGSALADLEREPDPLRIRVIAHQWWWQIEYEDPVPSRHVVTANELHIPTGRVVELELTASDVIHSFWVPNLHGKRDLIPGRYNYTRLRVDQPGQFRGQCAEFCGLQHAHMGLTVIAEPPEQFEGWMAHQREPARSPTTRRQMRGREIFLSGPCALCHAISGTPAGGGLGPDLTHIGSRATLAAGSVPNVRGYLAGWITDPQTIKPGARMPAYLLDGEDLQALVEYLESLK